MKQFIVSACVAALVATPAFASLQVGAKAPDFAAAASMGGKQFKFALADALDDFQKLGATVIGVSHDSIQTLDRFSLTECRSKFPVAADTDAKIMKSYDAVQDARAEYAERVSYVISPAGSILYSYTAGDPTHHVEYTMAAVRKYVAEQ